MPGRLLRRVCTACTTTMLAAQAVLLAPAAARAAPEPPEPGGRSVAELLTDLQRLYREAEKATEAYNTTEEKLRERRAETERIDAELATTRLSLQESRGAAGRLARQQYQNVTGISPYVRLLLARDPQRALDQGHVIGQLARERAETVGRLEGSERKADALARRARAALDAQLTLTERKKKERDDVRRRLGDVERLLASLSAVQLTALADRERTETAEAQATLVASGALSEERAPSPEGDRALRYAVGQLGKPYEWGAEGPVSYDCSGLTSQAWQHAGTPIPRTSQQQWARLNRVPLDRLRPGDLIVYFPDATHVALYAGKGMVVQAPRPGEPVKLSPIAANPILGAVRPDPTSQPLRNYKPLDLSRKPGSPTPKRQPRLLSGSEQGAAAGDGSTGGTARAAEPAPVVPAHHGP
ncbi:NlpC/P60 family protein [Streptomyces sp. NPDC101166]|uniref:C40 family peptidase n=1 Tax=Streptomyces sp. NPDC101166 TaxID=3366120 RepID=UPI00380AC1E5